MIFRDEAHLLERAEYWKAILRVRDWNVTIKFVNEGDITGHANGECQQWPALKDATIKIAKTKEDHDGVPYDQEQALVHELLHLHCNSFRPNKNPIAYEAWEAAINVLADSFVTLDRAKQPVTISAFVQVADIPQPPPINGHKKETVLQGNP